MSNYHIQISAAKATLQMSAFGRFLPIEAIRRMSALGVMASINLLNPPYLPAPSNRTPSHPYNSENDPSQAP